MHELRAALLIGLCAFSSGCHGRSSSSPTPPLQVQVQAPAPGSTAAVNANISVEFAADPAPDPATMTANALLVRDGSGPLAGHAAYDSSALRLTWISEREFPRGALLTVAVSDSVRSVNGNALATGSTWSFRVRAAVAAMPVTIKSGVTTGGSNVHVGLDLDGTSVIAFGDEAWVWTTNGLGPAESLPGVARGLHVDGAGNAVVIMTTVAQAAVAMGVSSRSTTGVWSPRENVFNSWGHYLSATLMGNERGDLMVQTLNGWATPMINQTVLHVRPATSAVGWLQFPVIYGAGGSAHPDVKSTLDGLGRVTSMVGPYVGGSGGFLIAERWDPLQGTSSMFTLAQVGANVYGGMIAGDRDGGLRAIWSQDGQVVMSRAPANAGFGPVVTGQPQSIFGPTWHAASSGAVVVREGAFAWRAEAGSDEWTVAEIGGYPLATAMSSRGEALMLTSNGISGSLVRWRAGDVIDPPLELGTLQPFAVAVDDVGRAVVIYGESQQSSSWNLVGVRIE